MYRDKGRKSNSGEENGEGGVLEAEGGDFEDAKKERTEVGQAF